MHPDLSTLIAYQDGELTPRRAQEIQSHLSKCTRCQRESTQLRQDLERYLHVEAGRSAAPPALGEDLENMLAGIRRWKSETPEADRLGVELSSRITAQLDVYLGSGAASLVGNRTGQAPHQENLLASMEPLLGAFLGRNSATALTNQLLQQIALERRLAPELLG
jgi:anti-sigma factor RsiW